MLSWLRATATTLRSTESADDSKDDGKGQTDEQGAGWDRWRQARRTRLLITCKLLNQLVGLSLLIVAVALMLPKLYGLPSQLIWLKGTLRLAVIGVPCGAVVQV